MLVLGFPVATPVASGEENEPIRDFQVKSERTTRTWPVLPGGTIHQGSSLEPDRVPTPLPPPTQNPPPDPAPPTAPPPPVYAPSPTYTPPQPSPAQALPPPPAPVRSESTPVPSQPAASVVPPLPSPPAPVEMPPTRPLPPNVQPSIPSRSVSPDEPQSKPHSVRIGGPAQASHYLQTGFALIPGTGYRLIVPYKENQFCGDRSKRVEARVCTQFVPFYTEFQLSFGIAPKIDLLTDLRFGIAEEPARPGFHSFVFAPGLRFWLDRQVSTKFYTSLQFVYDYVDWSGTGAGIRSSDFGVRNVNGFMYDPTRTVGLFIQFGETIGFVRWFRIDLDFSVGVQLRFP